MGSSSFAQFPQSWLSVHGERNQPVFVDTKLAFFFLDNVNICMYVQYRSKFVPFILLAYLNTRSRGSMMQHHAERPRSFISSRFQRSRYRRRSANPRRFLVEALEQRVLLAVNAALGIGLESEPSLEYAIGAAVGGSAQSAASELIQGQTRTVAAKVAQGPLFDEPPELTAAQRDLLAAHANRPLRSGPIIPADGTVRIGPASPTEPASPHADGIAAAAPLDSGTGGEIQLAPNDLEFFRNRPLDDIATGNSTSQMLQPSVGSAGRRVFQAGNWYGSLSDDNGQTWSYVNPFTLFPTSGSFAGGFCCDQRVVHDAARDMVLWYLQYNKTGSTASDTNGVRIAVAQDSDNLLNNTWLQYDFTPGFFGLPAGTWLNDPDIQVSNNFLYATSNVFLTQSNAFSETVMWRIPLSELKAGSTINVSFWRPNQAWPDASSIGLVNGATNTMFAGSVATATTFRVYNQPEANTTLFSTLLTGLNTTFLDTHSCPGSDGNNWCGGSDQRVQTGWDTGTQIGFMWNSSQGAGRPFPFVRALQLQRSNLSSVLGQPDLHSATSAWQYPAMAVNDRGHLAGTVFSGSSTTAPQTNILIADDLASVPPPWTTMVAATGTNGGNNVWGGYLGAQADDVFGNTWIATGYTQDGSGGDADIVPRFFWFGRERDNPGPNLRGTSFDVIQEMLAAGDTFDVDFRAINDGAAEAGASTTNFYLSTDNIISAADQLLGSFPLGALTAGSESATLSTSLTLPPLGDPFWVVDQTYFIGMIVDGTGVVVEYNESDNSNQGELIDFDGVAINVGVPTGQIHGRKWNDLDGDGAFEPGSGETVLAGWTIYLDLNDDGLLDNSISGDGICDGNAEEPCTITNINGEYSFTNLAPATYAVAEVPQPGWQQTFPLLDMPTWQPLGPSPIIEAQTPGDEDVSGRLVSIAPHPTDGNTIYVAGADGGVWKTTNGGQTWAPLTDDQATLAMGSIALAPSNPNIIYAGTGEAHFSSDSMYGRGILKSTDGGTTWTLLGNAEFNRRTISKIIVHPTDPNVVYAAVGRAGVNSLGGNHGVWKSTDGGSNWTNTTASISTSTHVSSLVMDPTNSDVLIAGFGEIFGDAANGLYQSNNGGTTWSPIGVGALPAGVTAGRVELAMSSDGQTVYASWQDPSTDGLLGFFQSINGGATWTDRTATTPDYIVDQGWYDNAIIVDPTNANRVYAGGSAGPNTLIRSDNGGVTWTDIGEGLDGIGPHVDHHAFAFDINGRLLNGNDGGIWRTTDMGLHWENLNSNLNITQFYDIAVHPTDPNIAYGGTQDNGTAKYVGSSTWEHIAGGDGGAVQVDFDNPNTIYQEFQYYGDGFFQRSDDEGTTLVAKTTGINTADEGRFIIPYELDPSDPTRLILGTDKVYESTNRADLWTPISPVLGDGVVAALDIAPSDPNTIYVSYTDGSVWVTFNGGGNWLQRDSLLPSPPPSGIYSGGNFKARKGPELIPQGLPGTVGVGDFAIDPTNNQIAYLVRDSFGLGKVWRTTNGGQFWTDISGNLPDLPAQLIVLDPRPATDVLYVAMDAQVYRSGNLGATWSLYGTGLPNSISTDLEINLDLEQLSVGTHGRGMWRTALQAGQSGPGPHTVVLGIGQIVQQIDFGNQETGPPQFLGRYIFYNNSKFDGNDATANANDDNAIAPDPDSASDPALGKTALLPGNPATFQNYTSYSRGINGIMVDIDNATNPLAIDVSDFVFRVGNNNNPGTWIAAPTPTVHVRENEGLAGSDRITIIWADNAIEQQWLEVTVLANSDTGLATNDVHYWGNQIAEIGNQAGSTAVNALDVGEIVNNPTGFFPAGIDNRWDLDRNDAVNALDVGVAVNHPTAFVSLVLFTPPIPPTPPPAAGNNKAVLAAAVAVEDVGPSRGSHQMTRETRLDRYRNGVDRKIDLAEWRRPLPSPIVISAVFGERGREEWGRPAFSEFDAKQLSEELLDRLASDPTRRL